MSEEKKNMEDLLQSELDLGDTEAVGAADDPFANIGANDDPFAGVNGTEDTFVDIENDNNNPFNDVAAEKTTEAGEMTAEGTGTEAVSETGVSEDAPAKSEMIKSLKRQELRKQNIKKRRLIIMRMYRMSRKYQIKAANKAVQIRLKLKSTEWKPKRLRKPRQVC